MIKVNWHRRYLQQAAWTRGLRDYLSDRTKRSGSGRILEVGCGTGAVLSTWPTSASLYGIDIDLAALQESHRYAPAAFLTRGDVLALAYPDRSFHISYCHFFLLWVTDPLAALMEMKRVTKSGGHVLAMAEPDYTARVDKPDELAALGKLQNQSLKRQGADIGIGSRLANLFFQAGIKIIETGLIQSRQNRALSWEDGQQEWEIIESDLTGLIPPGEILRWKKMDAEARRHRTRVLNVPTYFAWGQV